MTWDYEVCETDYVTGKWYSIREARLIDGDTANGTTESILGPGGETLDELRDDILKMLYAVEKTRYAYASR